MADRSQPGTELVVRQYQPADAAAIWTLHNEALWSVGAHLGNGAWDADLHAIEAVYLHAGGEFLVGVVAEQVVAMGALQRQSPEHAIIKRMRVSPAYQRRGFGHTILMALEQRARELGYRMLHLDTTLQQVAAQRLYERHGYQERQRGMLGPFSCIFYEKVLDGPATTGSSPNL